MIHEVRDYVRSVLELLSELRAFDRALALASKMFIALIPMALLASTVFPGDSAFADGIVARFGLTGEGADAVRTLFASPEQVRGGITALSILVLAYSVISMAGGLQRLYEEAWHLPGMRLGGLVRAMAWMLTLRSTSPGDPDPERRSIVRAGFPGPVRPHPGGHDRLGLDALHPARGPRRAAQASSPGLITAVCFAVFSVLSRV